MSLVKQVFVLDELNQVGPNAKQHALVKRLLSGNPEISFYIPSNPEVSFPDANSTPQDPGREGWSITFTYPVHAGDLAGPAGLAALYVDIKEFIEETNRKGTLENALSSQGVISGQMNQYMADVLIGHWLLTEALIISASIDESGAPNQKSDPTHITMAIHFSAVLR